MKDLYTQDADPGMLAGEAARGLRPSMPAQDLGPGLQPGTLAGHAAWVTGLGRRTGTLEGDASEDFG